MYLIVSLLIALFCTPVFAGVNVLQDVSSDQSVSQLNDNFQSIDARTRGLQASIAAIYPIDLSLYGVTVKGNLSINDFNSGTNASSTTFWRGDGAWVTSTVYGNSNHQVFTATGTWTAPAGITKVYLSMIGAGASGGYSTSSGSHAAAGGGGGGEYVIKFPYTVMPGNTYNITINPGGTVPLSQGNDGNNGGTTVFDTLTLAGGLGGKQGPSSTTGGAGGKGGGAAGGNGGAGATGSNNGSVGSPGGSGGSGGIASGANTQTYGVSGSGGGGASVSNGGAGANSIFGYGGLGGSATTSSNGTPAVGYGVGGGGSSSQGQYTASAGTSGIVIIDW